MGHSMSADPEVGAWRASVVLVIARSVVGGARLKSWPGARGGCEDLVNKGEQAESCDGDEPYSGAVEKCSGSRTTFSPELPSLSLFFSL